MAARPTPTTAPKRLPADAWPAIGVLSESRRREAYDFVVAQNGPVTRDEVSAALSMTRSLAAFHLDKLAGAGLLATSFRRPADRVAGPGAGRPSKLYEASDLEISVSIPPRRYDILGRIMAKAIGSINNRSDGAATAARRIARQEGFDVGQQHTTTGRKSTKKLVAAVSDTLAQYGYEPRTQTSSILLVNCPYRALVDVAPRLVCDINENFVAGVIAGLRADEVVAAELCGPIGSNCCVRIRPVRSGD
jgi:predicted ArsR family transcriptional regulator